MKEHGVKAYGKCKFVVTADSTSTNLPIAPNLYRPQVEGWGMRSQYNMQKRPGDRCAQDDLVQATTRIGTLLPFR